MQYLWIENYKCIKDQEFNFTDRVTFHYDKKENRISCIKHNKNYYDNFFGKNIELTCIVGQNGAGKTTLLKLIADIADNPGINGFYNYIAVFYDGKKYIGYSYSSSVHKSLDVKHNPVEMEFDNYSYDTNGVLEYRPIASARCLYYSDSFTEAQAEFSRYYKSFSTLSFLRGSYIDNMTFDWQITTFFEKEFIRQLRLIGDYKNIIEKFHIRYCPYISTFFSISYDLLDNWIEVFLDKDPVRRDKDKKYLHGIINKFLFDIVETKGMDRFKSNLAYAVFCTIVHHLSNDISKFKRKQFDSIINIMKFPKSKDVWNRVLDLLNDEFWIKGENIILLPNRKELIGFMKFIDEKAKFSKNAFRNYSFSVGFTIPIGKENNNENYDFQTDIETFYDEYRRAVGLFNFLDFSWGLSSGEMSLLNIFSILYSKVKKIDSPDRKKYFSYLKKIMRIDL